MILHTFLWLMSWGGWQWLQVIVASDVIYGNWGETVAEVGLKLRKVPWSSIEQTEDCLKKTHLSFPRLFARCPHLDFFWGELWFLGDATVMSFVHGSEAVTWRSSVTGCFWGPSWRSSWFPGARFFQPTIYSCCSMMISVWRMWWKTMVLASKRSKSGFLVFGVNGGLVRLGFRAFFFSTMYQLKGKQLRNPQLDFCRRVQPLGGFRIYHCSKDIQTQGTPRSWFWCVCRSKNASLLDKMEGKRLVNVKYCEYEVVLNNSDLQSLTLIMT